MKFPRASGVLLHPTSLPGEFGIGDFGHQAFKFVDVLAEAGQRYWQVLPLGPTGYGDSPYQCLSAFAGNTLLISPEKLLEDDLITNIDTKGIPDLDLNKIDFRKVYGWKSALLDTAFKDFQTSAHTETRGKFESFCRENTQWLDDYALYRAVKISQCQKPWYEWPDKLKLRDKRTIDIAKEQLTPEIQREKFYQFLFFHQWLALKEYANSSGLKIIGDIPIFVALDSADVWRHQDKFKLNPDGTAKVVAGVPPDYFSKTGQLWGNPIYDWDAMRDDGFDWWIERFRSTFKMVDIARVDHFRGFAAAWEVPGEDKTAENGNWVDVPGQEMFEAVTRELGELPLIAEDLGVITPDVEELRDEFGFPGMRILQFAFSGDAKNHDLPHNYVSNCVAYTGTHDNDTTVGWWRSKVGSSSTRGQAEINREREYCLGYLNSDGDEINWDFIRAVWASVADIAITPLQDLIGSGTESRMNLPATTTGNWTWRFRDGAITDEIVDRLNKLTGIYGRK